MHLSRAQIDQVTEIFVSRTEIADDLVSQSGLEDIWISGELLCQVVMTMSLYFEIKCRMNDGPLPHWLDYSRGTTTLQNDAGDVIMTYAFEDFAKGWNQTLAEAHRLPHLTLRRALNMAFALLKKRPKLFYAMTAHWDADRQRYRLHFEEIPEAIITNQDVIDYLAERWSITTDAVSPTKE